MIKFLFILCPIHISHKENSCKFYHSKYLEFFIVKGILNDLQEIEKYLNASQTSLSHTIENSFFNQEKVTKDSNLIH
jgi:hypothetical protein